MTADPTALEAARSAKAALAERYAGDSRIAGIGIAPDGQGGYEVKVNVTEAEATWDVPAEMSGVPVRTEVVGEIRPL